MNNQIKIVIGMVFCSVLLLTCDAHKQQTSIIGEWAGSNDDYNMSILFQLDETCEITIYDRQSFATEFIDGVYEVDYSKSPLPISIRKISAIDHPLHTIIKPISRDSIRVAYFSPNWKLRQISFEHNKYIDLVRVIESNKK